MAEDKVFIGIDVTTGKKPIKFAILDKRLHVLKTGAVTLEKATEIVLSYPQSVCAVDSPSGENKGFLDQPDFREKVGLPPHSGSYNTYRLCEYEIRRRFISIYNTPLEAEKARKWIKTGWQFYKNLREEGFVDYPQRGSRQIIETHPQAGFTVMLKKRPYRKAGLEGRLQRQLVLYQEGVDVPDPMYILQEWTRHSLINGELPFSDIHTHYMLDALMAAYTAFICDVEPENTVAVGDTIEGQILLPTKTLLDSYRSG